MPPPNAKQQATDAWYVSPGGNVWYATGGEADLLKWVLGWAGPFTYANAEAYAKTTPAPERALNKAATSGAKDVGQAAGSGLAGLADVGDFFHRLTETKTWTRVGEVVVGGILLYAGIRALTHGSTVAGAGARKSATAPVKKVAKAAATVAAPEVRAVTRTVAKRAAPKTTARYAAHREHVRVYGQKKPYTPPKPKPPAPPRTTYRISHIVHHTPDKPPKAVKKP